MTAKRAGTNELAEWSGSVWEPIMDLRDAVCVHEVVDELSAVSVAWPGEGENGMVVEFCTAYNLRKLAADVRRMRVQFAEIAE